MGTSANGTAQHALPDWRESTMPHEEESTLSGEAEITLGEMGRTMIRVERKLDESLAAMERKVESSLNSINREVEAGRKDHEDRIRALESWMWKSIGAGAGAGGLVAGVVAIILKA